MRSPGRKTRLAPGAIDFVRLAAALVLVVPSALVSVSGHATDVTGIWIFSVDLGAAGQASPMFTFKQSGQQITGTYEGQLGKHNITGRVNGNTIFIKLQISANDGPLTLAYTGKIDSPDSMSGSVNVLKGSTAMTGTWHATR
jgi:hypothetical protein